jgi:hypothetical protein
MNTKDKEIRDGLESNKSGTQSNLAIARFKSEKDTDNTAHEYKMKMVRTV